MGTSGNKGEQGGTRGNKENKGNKGNKGYQGGRVRLHVGYLSSEVKIALSAGYILWKFHSVLLAVY